MLRRWYKSAAHRCKMAIRLDLMHWLEWFFLISFLRSPPIIIEVFFPFPFWCSFYAFWADDFILFFNTAGSYDNSYQEIICVGKPESLYGKIQKKIDLIDDSNFSVFSVNERTSEQPTIGWECSDVHCEDQLRCVFAPHQLYITIESINLSSFCFFFCPTRSSFKKQHKKEDELVHSLLHIKCSLKNEKLDYLTIKVHLFVALFMLYVL